MLTPCAHVCVCVCVCVCVHLTSFQVYRLSDAALRDDFQCLNRIGAVLTSNMQLQSARDICSLELLYSTHFAETMRDVTIHVAIGNSPMYPSGIIRDRDQGKTRIWLREHHSHQTG